jgi:hypothetical protein
MGECGLATEGKDGYSVGGCGLAGATGGTEDCAVLITRKIMGVLGADLPASSSANITPASAAVTATAAIHAALMHQRIDLPGCMQKAPAGGDRTRTAGRAQPPSPDALLLLSGLGRVRLALDVMGPA